MPPISSASSRAARVAGRDPGRVGRAVARAGDQPRGRAGRAASRVVSELSTDCMTSAITVRSDQPRTDSIRGGQPGLPDDAAQPAADPVRAAVDQQRLEQAHRVGAAPVADRLDVGLRVGVERAGDRHPVGEVEPLGRACWRGTEAPRIASELVRVSSPRRGESPGSAPSARIRVQQPLGAERAGGEDHLVGVDHLRAGCAARRRCARCAPRTRRRRRAGRRSPWSAGAPRRRAARPARGSS